MALEGDTPKYRRRSDRQRDEARAVANAQRSRKARLKSLIRHRELDAIEVLEGKHPEWDDALGATKLYELLRSIPRVGPLTMEEIAEDLGASLHVRVRSLEPEQREQLVLILKVMRGDNL